MEIEQQRSEPDWVSAKPSSEANIERNDEHGWAVNTGLSQPAGGRQIESCSPLRWAVALAPLAV